MPGRPLRRSRRSRACRSSSAPKTSATFPGFFGGEDTGREGYGAFDIEILAEINHAPRLTLDEILAAAEHYRSEGADLIDVGCDPGGRWAGVGAAVEELRRRGFRVSIDSFDPVEVGRRRRRRGRAGPERQRDEPRPRRDPGASRSSPSPTDPGTWTGSTRRSATSATRASPSGSTRSSNPSASASPRRWAVTWRPGARYPDVAVMMGVGNLTELTDVDSAGVNTLLIGFCQELGVRSVLTTEVINWARSSVKEIDLARRLMYHAVTRRTLPKHLEPGLVTLRDVKVARFGPQALAEMAARIKDPNWRIFAEDGRHRRVQRLPLPHRRRPVRPLRNRWASPTPRTPSTSVMR